MDKNAQPKLTKKQNSWMLIKFILFSASAGIIQFGSFTLLNEFAHLDKYTRLDELLGNDYGLSYFIALVLSVLWNFTLNRKFTFKSVANVPVAMLKIFGYYLVFTPLSLWWGVKLTNLGWNYYLVLGITMLANLSTEFIYDRFVVYRNNIYTSKAAMCELREKADETK
ncbi:MAG: GtrA family protein [Firmicutes bacterium HGW-Firmicutes-16]|nr:MAG: GtrA family protein [Firmicutes bacterium HGW-Firmicutes-16]